MAYKPFQEDPLFQTLQDIFVKTAWKKVCNNAQGSTKYSRALGMLMPDDTYILVKI